MLGLKAKHLGNGLRLTQSDDGIFLHFTTLDGQPSGGICLDKGALTPGKKWAIEILESVKEVKHDD